MIQFLIDEFHLTDKTTTIEARNGDIYFSATIKSNNISDNESAHVHAKVFFNGHEQSLVTIVVKNNPAAIASRITQLLVMAKVITKPTYICYYFNKVAIEQHFKGLSNIHS